MNVTSEMLHQLEVIDRLSQICLIVMTTRGVLFIIFMVIYLIKMGDIHK